MSVETQKLQGPVDHGTLILGGLFTLILGIGVAIIWGSPLAPPIGGLIAFTGALAYGTGFVVWCLTLRTPARTPEGESVKTETVPE